jgi:hypothetical protein
MREIQFEYHAIDWQVNWPFLAAVVGLLILGVVALLWLLGRRR